MASADIAQGLVQILKFSLHVFSFSFLFFEFVLSIKRGNKSENSFMFCAFYSSHSIHNKE